MQNNETFDNAYGLIIAICKYGRIRSLPEVEDGPDLRDVLTDPKLCGYPSNHVTTLTNGEATSEAIVAQLQRLASICTKSSTLFVYFSGHGGRIASGDNAGEYLLPYDTNADSEQDVAQTALSSQRFNSLISAIPARRVFLVFDCCHAGGIGQTKDIELGIDLESGMSSNFYDVLASGSGRAVLASCKPNEVSYVMPGARNGLFTEHLLAGMRGAISSEDGLVRVFDLFEYVQPSVSRIQATQHPYFKFEGDENLPIALYQGGARGTVARVDSEFIYDVYVTHAEDDSAIEYVNEKLLPALRSAGLRVAVSYDCEEPGVDRVISRERGIERSRRTVVALSRAFLNDQWAVFDEVAATTLGIEEGKYRVLPVKIEAFESSLLPLRLRKLVILDLASPARSEQAMEKLVETLKRPLTSRI